ncbi:MAG: sigma-E processing peptidase SpoIIGA [Eubacteriales bacterium]|nr:sigma-E processing peptidase SpoIIGA [Eubacteriales bacterium]MDD3881292.1 sigma-E processing peptidase SpoIIGA [Eubacteriales bacterium]MDD4512210.1 sigma-E processing peptidase SpoIIGA [Eubacteriales bacterium]
MRVSLELFLLVNLLMDLSALMLARALADGCPRRGGLIGGAFLGAVYAFLSYLPPLSVLRSFPCAVAFSLVLSFVSFRFLGAWRVLWQALVLLLSVGALGGVCEYIARNSVPVAWALCAVWLLAFAFSAAYMRAKRVTSRKRVAVRLYYHYRRYSFTALVDSGNLILAGRERAPVIMLSRDTANKVFAGIVPGADYLPPDAFPISVTTVSGVISLPCVRPDSVELLMRRGWEKRSAYICVGRQRFTDICPASLCTAA